MFLVKFESSVLCTPEAYIGHLGYFIPHLINKQADNGFKVLKKYTSKTEKNEKTRSSWLNCALRDYEAVYSVSIGHFEAVAVGN